MRRLNLHNIVACITLAIGCWFALPLPPVHADSLSLLTNLEYDVINTETTDKNMNNTKTKNESAVFSQLYKLDLQKEIFPTLKLNTGGLFDQDDRRAKTQDSTNTFASESRNTAIQPFFDLQFATPILSASAGYRKRHFKESPADGVNDQTFKEESSASINWDPVGLPELDLYFTRTQAYNKPLTNELQTDNYQLKSEYDYKNFTFAFNHTTNDVLNKQTDFKTLTNFDNGSIRFFKTYRQNKVSLNSSLRGNRQQSEFYGEGDRLRELSFSNSFYNSEDPPPATTTSQIDFNGTLAEVNLLQDGAQQISVGVSFISKVFIDTVYLEFVDDPLTNQASSSEIDGIKSLFSWNVFVSNDQITWIQVSNLVSEFNPLENRFEFSFDEENYTHIKITVTPIQKSNLPNKEIRIQRLVPYQTLAPNTSKFTSTDWTGDLNLNLKLSDKTLAEYNVLYREQRSDPLGEKKTLLTNGAGLRHIFNDIFTGNMRVRRSETRNEGEKTNISHNYSAALAARYMETFNQSLTYSFSHQNDEESQTTISNAIFLRNNLDLYQGWSLYIDNGYSWQNPAEGEDINTTFVRVGSNIVPNRWLNTTLSYGVSWARESGKPVSRDQDARVAVSWVPTSTISLSANFSFTDQTGENKDSTAAQQYSVNWSPLRDGTLFFSLSYGQSEDDKDKKSWNLSPALRWQINRKTLLTFDYGIGERDDENEVVAFESIGLALRIFY